MWLFGVGEGTSVSRRARYQDRARRSMRQDQDPVLRVRRLRLVDMRIQKLRPPSRRTTLPRCLQPHSNNPNPSSLPIIKSSTTPSHRTFPKSRRSNCNSRHCSSRIRSKSVSRCRCACSMTSGAVPSFEELSRCKWMRKVPVEVILAESLASGSISGSATRRVASRPNRAASRETS